MVVEKGGEAVDMNVDVVVIMHHWGALNDLYLAYPGKRECSTNGCHQT